MVQELIPIRYTDADQQSETLQKIASEVAKILTASEEILYVALQAPVGRRDCVVATSNRIIFYRPKLIGGVDFADLHWQDVKDVRIKQGMAASDFTAETHGGRVEVASWLHKEQTKRLYGIAQQLEQEWREKRRVRDMEEARARAGGIVMTVPQSAPPAGNGAAAPPAEEPVARLAKAKALLERRGGARLPAALHRRPGRRAHG